MNRWSVAILVFIFFCLGLIIGYKSNAVNKITKTVTNSNEVREGGYSYINPLLECEYTENFGSTEFAALESDLKRFVDSDGSNLQETAIYFRDLNNGPWFGINQDADFAPASLLKVPVMMAYLKISESDNTLLQKKIKFEERIDISQSPVFLADSDLKIGEEYTIDELLTRMIVNSDNQALFLLRKNISQEQINEITLDLGVTTPITNTPDDFMSVKSYASLFRILYNASYLEKNSSEKALSLLAKTKFDKGLVAGVSKNIIVSHKFGEAEIQSGVKQLHDCGIVYYPRHPYLVCIMTRGNDYEK